MGDLEYGMYGDGYDEYDEDDFFYHMYFDEVSTTHIPPEFYDLLESVSLSPNSGQTLRPAQAPGGRAPLAPMPRPLEGHNSAPDLLPGFHLL